MVECFLLLVHSLGPWWAPLVAIPLVLAGMAASLRLILSGCWGVLAAQRHSRPRASRESLANAAAHGLWWMPKK